MNNEWGGGRRVGPGGIWGRGLAGGWGIFFGKKFGVWDFFVIFAFANGLFNY